MSDYFIQQWGGFEITMVSIIIFVIGVTVFGIIPTEIENYELNKEQKELIPKLNCIELGELILNEEVRRANTAFAEKHWHIRCEN